MKFLVIDLELNKTGDEDLDGETTDIIQIGAVIYNTDTRQIEEKFNRYIKHYDDRGRLSKFIVKLTGITDDIINNEAIDIVTAVEELNEFGKVHNVQRIVQWGGGDFECLMEQYTQKCTNPHLYDIEIGSRPLLYVSSSNSFSKIISPQASQFKGSPLNLKHVYQIFALSEGISPRGGLSTCLKKLGINFVGRKHNALDDAYNTAIILDRILNNKSIIYKSLLEESVGRTTSSNGLTDIVLVDTIKQKIEELNVKKTN